ncbi:hypothetical protein M422DRAFT_254533 [Sphaerobolus stellatus SS14]|uniref:RRM domain-containing protein n=1 Tax=Sphaerobolus stellatus (strain SS14) TaxID=990650 RepID=A0A0C9VL74_SPHS4|nr:hypothetical protein M422DRAFT_254533 [Sphaerobolus stellatus SS14]
MRTGGVVHCDASRGQLFPCPPTPILHPTVAAPTSTSTLAPSTTLSDEHPAITLMTPTPPPSATKQAELQPQSQSQSPSRTTSPKWRANPDTDTDANSTTTSTANPTPTATTNTNTQQQPTIKPSQSQSTVSSLLHLRPLAASTLTLTNAALSPRATASMSSCNIPPPSPAAIAATCLTSTPNPLQRVSRLLVAHNQLTRYVNRTTNVYINGLLPHFKAEQLYTLASQCGTVLSCRTFTCQLSDDHPSGHGFVLFVIADAAQKCIDVLRSHHNLHPMFAKAIPSIMSCPISSFPILPSLSTLHPQNRALAAPHQHNEPVPVRRRLRPRTRARAFYLVSASWSWLVDFEFVYWDGDGYWWRLVVAR